MGEGEEQNQTCHCQKLFQVAFFFFLGVETFIFFPQIFYQTLNMSHISYSKGKHGINRWGINWRMMRPAIALSKIFSSWPVVQEVGCLLILNRAK